MAHYPPTYAVASHKPRHPVTHVSHVRSAPCIQLYDGQPLGELHTRWLRDQTATVSQEPTLFARSLRDNIAYGDCSREVPMADIILAARQAHIHQFIESLQHVSGASWYFILSVLQKRWVDFAGMLHALTLASVAKYAWLLATTTVLSIIMCRSVATVTADGCHDSWDVLQVYIVTFYADTST